MYIRFTKPVVDWLGALAGLILLSPLFVFITIILTVKNQGRIFFFQKRPGLHGKPFLLLKFKTLLDSRGETGVLLPDYQRQFGFGSFLRHFHLDELPQFINILKGDINFIGPRPLLMEYLGFYNARQKTRHNVKPGIIGLSQIMGGNKLDWPQRLRLDVFYVDHQSFALDWLIIKRTVKYFFQKKIQPDEASMFSAESFLDYAKKQADQVHRAGLE